MFVSYLPVTVAVASHAASSILLVLVITCWMEIVAVEERAKALFKEKFGGDAKCCGVAPGRVNLIGEHTDYNDGFVFPAALELQTVVLGRRRADGAARATVYAESFPGDKAEFDVSSSTIAEL